MAIESLYPSSYGKQIYVDSINTPSFQKEYNPFERSENPVYRFYGKRLLQEFQIKSGENIIDTLGYVDKLYPHSYLDMMILASDIKPRSSFPSLSKTTNSTILKTAKNFVDFVSNIDIFSKYNLEDGFLHFCYNYDPDTTDRESGMSYEKRFHLHMNYWSGREISLANKKKISNIESTSYRRRLIDPLTILGESIFYEANDGEICSFSLLKPDIARDIELGLPAGIKVKFDSWEIFNSETLVDLMRKIHFELSNLYNIYTNSFLEEKNPENTKPWTRRKLLSLDDINYNISKIDYLSKTTQEKLKILGRTLRNISPKTMNYLKKREDYRIRHLSLGGLNYSLGFYTPCMNTVNKKINSAGPVYLVIQPKLFADIGGAGLPYMGNIPIVKINRENGFFDEAEKRRRQQFHQEFIEYNNHILSTYKEISMDSNNITCKG